MTEEGVLLYCITSEKVPNLEEIKGIDSLHSLYAIEYNNLYGICSQVSLKEYGEENIEKRGEDIDWLTEKAYIFMDIMQRLNDQSIIIPMKFLTIFKDENRVKDIIKTNYDTFDYNLHKLTDCEELSVKIYCNHKQFKEKSMDEEIDAFNKTLEGKPKGAAFFLKKKFESELDQKVQNKVKTVVNSIIKSIEPYTVELKMNKLLAKELTGISDSMVANCAILIQEEKKDEFIKFISKQIKNYEESGLTIEYTGPWPPYNFCT